MKKIFLLLFCWQLLLITCVAQTTIDNNYKDLRLSSKRSEILLNNRWLFQPATGNATEKPVADKWSLIQVPSSWSADDVLIERNSADKEDLKNLSKAWYQTTVFIPKKWKENATELVLTKVSTDAVVYLNGKKAGGIEWYSGAVDISNFVQYGKQNLLQIFVIATGNEGEIPVLMGTATTQVTFTKATLASKGIIGDVLLSSRPSNAFVTDVFVQPSVRQNKVDVAVEIAGIKKAGIVSVTANMQNEQGVTEKSFTTTINVMEADTQTLKLSFDWASARLWDLDKPELYTLKLKVAGKNLINDEYAQEFGFREFWIDGKHFYLNGKKINLRPHLFVGGNGMDELIDASIDGIRKNGFNISEIWPNNFDERGFLEHTEQMMNRADRKGFLLMGIALPFVNYIVDKNWSFQWNKPGVKESFEHRMKIALRRDRNHPSVVMWTTTGNFFGDTQDQNPFNIGRTNWIKNSPTFQKNAKAGIEAINIIKKNDPTRPVFTHHGTYVGDVHTLNFYLNMLPLQEREEWMSFYSQNGQIPFIGIEFGTPLHCTFLRGRNGFGNNIKTEPWVTEFTAMYMGDKAYLNEPKNYRDLIANNFISGQTYQDWPGPVVMEKMWSFQQIQSLFTTNTWRSWRTYDMPGGMLPWNNGHGWTRTDTASTVIKMKPFGIGRKGMYYPTASVADINDKLPPAYTVQPGGKAFIENNNATLAYIAGAEAAFTAKDHHFTANQFVGKQAFFFNDTRQTQSCVWNYMVTIGDKIIAKNEGELLIPVGDKKSEKINFTTPSGLNNFKTEGNIILNARIGNVVHADTFHFRVFKEEAIAGKKEVNVFDPVGKSTDMLMALGYTVLPWKGETNIPFLIIGRDALSKNYALPFSLQKFVDQGGKALVLNQQDSLLEKSGFRISKYVSRYVFPLNNNPLTNLLDELDLRNWSGVGTMINPYPDYMNNAYEKSPDESPLYGWHWGNRGSVATNAMEKPHNSGWTPLLECEFDMAYSPLMKLNVGKGSLIWCSLDLEDHATQDPVAAIVAKRLITYVQNAVADVRNKNTIFMGGKNESKLLDDVGMIYKKADKVEATAELIICGNTTAEQEKALVQYVQNGGKILLLPKTKPGIYFGAEYVLDENFDGGKTIANWPLTNGLSISDIRYRTAAATIKIASGCDISLDGLLGKKQLGKGEIIYCQLEPNRFNADSLTYFRFTRWRATRAFAQVATNLGATFTCDLNIFKEEKKEVTHIDLDKTIWKAKITVLLPAADDMSNKVKDPGISKEAAQLLQETADESAMINTNVPMTNADEINTILQSSDGEVVFRKTIEIPDNMLGKDLVLNLAAMDDFDNTYFNGVPVGFTDDKVKENWSFVRTYTVPAKLVKPGKNVIAIRIWDWYGGGGIFNSSPKREITLKEKPVEPVSLYHSDYRTDFELGDNPFRYFRW